MRRNFHGECPRRSDFTETEQPERDFFKAALAEHDLRFLTGIREVEADAEILCIFITSRIDASFLDEHPELKLITTKSAGHDRIDVSECSRRNVIVCELPGSNANTVAEQTFALMLALSRRIVETREVKKETRFSFERWRGFELENKTLGVIGTGQIGQRVIHLALAFGMKVLAYDPYQQTVTEGVRYLPLYELLRESHIISLHTPLTAETFHLLDRDAFAQCRRGALIINTARGAVSAEQDSMCSKKKALCERTPAKSSLTKLSSASTIQRLRKRLGRALPKGLSRSKRSFAVSGCSRNRTSSSRRTSRLTASKPSNACS
jgi:lactate dehydrogenase-like 2-hydroxyacid dehydrogenase